MHDDIIFYTSDWGKKLQAHFADEKVGAVGIAGTPYLAWTAGGWWSSGAGHLYLLQSAKHDPAPVMQHYFPDDSASEEVVVLDGVWFCIRREIFRDIRFDEANFKGFHFYDVDTTLQVRLAGYRLLCIRDILIHHLSSGVLDQKWVDNALIFHEKWKDRLPMHTKEYSLSRQCHMEYRVLNEMMHTRLADGTDKPSKVFSFALSQMLGFKKGWRYFRTPFWFAKLLARYIKSRM
jgi:GT2 family glycosyltransferase